MASLALVGHSHHETVLAVCCSHTTPTRSWDWMTARCGRMFHVPAGSQILGEQAILEANDDLLRTVALRPSGIFGEGDPIFVPTVVKQVCSAH